MNRTTHRVSVRMPARRQRGLTLIELAVTMVIALFLLGGVLMMVQNTRSTYSSQTQLAQLQDNERLAMTIMTDVIQSAGYFPNPVATDAGVSLPVNAPFGKAGQAFYGPPQSTTAPQDSISIRYATSSTAVGVGDGILNCLGTSNVSGASVTYTNTFDLTAADASGNRSLECTLSDGTTTTTQPLVGGITDMQIYYGVKRTATNDFNVDTYVRAADMQPNDWVSVSAVRVILTFSNPAAPGTTGKTIPFERVIAVMNKAGNMT